MTRITSDMPEAKSSLLSQLVAVRELLSAPGRWTRGASARNIRGGREHALDSNAVCWCLSGAMEKCAPGDGEFARMAEALRPYLEGYASIPVFNDATNRAEVLAVLNRAIAKEQG